MRSVATNELDFRVGLSILICGLRIGIQASDEGALQRLLDYIPGVWKPSTSSTVERLYSYSPGHGDDEQLYIDGQRVRGPKEDDGTLRLLESDLTTFLIAKIRNRVCIHAGVVGWKDRALVIPGQSHTGKTTLVAELVRAGALYYSEELALIDPRGRVHPFPRKLQIWNGPSVSRVSAEELGGRIGSNPVPVSAVIFTQYQCGVTWEPELLPAAQGALRLLEYGLGDLMERPEQTLASLAQVASSAQILVGPRGEASETANLMLDKIP